MYSSTIIPTQVEIKNIIEQMAHIHNAKLESDFIYDKWTITNFVKEYAEKGNVFDNYEKHHSTRTYDYLSQNQLLLSQINDDNIPNEELNKIVDNIKKMYEKQDDRLIKILKLIA